MLSQSTDYKGAECDEGKLDYVWSSPFHDLYFQVRHGLHCNPSCATRPLATDFFKDFLNAILHARHPHDFKIVSLLEIGSLETLNVV